MLFEMGLESSFDPGSGRLGLVVFCKRGVCSDLAPGLSFRLGFPYFGQSPYLAAGVRPFFLGQYFGSEGAGRIARARLRYGCVR